MRHGYHHHMHRFKTQHANATSSPERLTRPHVVQYGVVGGAACLAVFKANAAKVNFVAYLFAVLTSCFLYSWKTTLQGFHLILIEIG
jgi:hypothetical protein